jgi:predicted RecB family nuclease
MKPKELIEIESLIRSRIKLPTNQKKLESFGFTPLDLVKNKKEVAEKYRSFDEKRQEKFITLIGGSVNFNKVKSYVEKL